MKNSFWATAIILIIGIQSCNEGPQQKHLLGVVRDSCRITAIEKVPADTNFLNLILSFETNKQISSESQKAELFEMENRLELIADGAVSIPIFCQAIATGNKEKFSYWVSFEDGKAAVTKELRILPNSFVRDTVYYKL